MASDFARWIQEQGSTEALLAHASTLMNMPSKELIHPVEDLIQSALMAPVENDYPNSEVVSFLKALAERESDNSHVKVTSMIVDLLWMMEIENEFVSAAQKERMILLTKDIIAQGFIPVRMMKERWEIEFLEEVGLIPNAKMFLKRVVRINTAQLYKQQKYNLLREESEGYSKLITELSTGTADSDDAMEIASKVDAVLTNIISLIGYFDLDPNRVLDIALDVFAANVATHHQFFIEFLRKSPWNSQSGLQGIAIRNRACAQVLGFKFQTLQRPEHRHKSPIELYTVAALLIRHSIVHMEDIYPHLSLSDEVMEKEYATFKSAMKDKANSFKSNPLAMAGALVDDTVVGASSTSSVKDQPVPDTTHAEAAPELPLPNQKVGVVNALLSIGDLENAMFLFARFPNVTASYPETADLLCRLIHVMIQNVYAPFSPATCHKALAKDRSASYRHPTVLKDREVAVVRVLSPNLPLATSTQRFEFFFQGWKDNIRCFQNVSDLVEQMRPLLNVVGVRIHRDTILVTKLCRIGAGTMSRLRTEITQREKINSDGNDGERSGADNAKLSSLKSELQHVENAWIEMAGSLFLPSMSLTYSNPGLVNEVWQVLKGLRYEDRYSLYGFWKGTAPNRYPELQVVTAATEKEAKSVMRRINKEDVKQYGRMFAKYAHSNPQIVFAAAMKQLEGGYDNMVQPLVDACKYLTDMGQDVLTYALLESLSKTTRSKVQDDGTSPAKWMITLSSFSGQLYRKYNSPDLSGILQYIVNQLRISSVNDLVVLRELLAKMGGIEETSNLNSSQLLAMAGGELLKNETLFGGVTGTIMKKNVRSCLRLQEAMMRDDIASQLLVLLAQHRQMSIFGDNMVSHLKLLSNLFDQAHTTLLQFLEFLSTNLHKEYPSFVPSLTELCQEYSIESNIAMCVIRPKLQELILKEQRLKAVSKLKADDKQAAEATSTADNSSAMDVDGQETEKKDESTTVAPVWLPSLEPIAEEVTNILPPRALRGLKPHFFVTFWQLTLYDIFVPVDQYKAEIAKLKHAAHVMDSDRTTYSSSVQAKRGRDRDRLFHAAARLDMEMESQLANHKRVMERLHRESQHWFRNLKSERQEVINQVIHHCLYPRAILSNLDALYCAKFVQLMHSIGTSDLSTLTLYDKLLLETDRVIFLSTESEAKCYGGFLCEILTNLARWHGSRTLYEKEGRGVDLPGFQKKWSPRNASGKINEEDLLDYEDFRHALYKWHTKLYMGLSNALESGEYMRIKNSIMILREISTCYPTMIIIGSRLFDTVKDIATKEERDDLKLLANAYLGVLKKGKDSGAWMRVAQFHIPTNKGDGASKEASAPPQAPGSSGSSSNQARPASARQSDSRSDARDSEDRSRSAALNSLSAANSTVVQGSRDRVSSIRDTRVGGTVSPGGPGRRNVFPLPPKPGTPVHEGRLDAPSSRDAREQPARDSRDSREREPQTSAPQPRAEKPLLVISLKSGPSDRDTQENKDSTKDTKSDMARDSSKDMARDNSKDTNRDSTREVGVSQGRDNRREGDTPKEGSRDSNSRERNRDFTEDSDRDSRGETRSSSMMSPDNRDRRDPRDTSRKELRDLAPRDPRDRDSRDMLRTDSRDGRDGRDGRDSRDGRDVRDVRDGRDSRDNRDGRDTRAGVSTARDGRDNRAGASVARDSRDTRADTRADAPAARDGRDTRQDAPAARDGRDMRQDVSTARDARDTRADVSNARDGRDARTDTSATRNGRDVREPRDGREARMLSAPKDPREAGREDLRDGKDGRYGGSRNNSQRDQASDSPRVSSSRNNGGQGETAALQGRDGGYDGDRERPREDRYREDERKNHGRESTDRIREKDAALDQEKSMDRNGDRDRRTQGRDKPRDNGRDQVVSESLSTGSNRDRPRTESGSRDTERRATDRRDTHRDREELNRAGSLSSSRQDSSSRDRDRRSSRRQGTGGDAESKSSSRESQGKSDRRGDSSERKRGRGSRDASVDGEKDSKRHRDVASASENVDRSSRSSSRKRKIEPDDRPSSSKDRSRDDSSATPTDNADSIAMPPPVRAESSLSISSSFSPVSSSSLSTSANVSNAKSADTTPPSSTSGSKRIKLNRPSDNDSTPRSPLPSGAGSSNSPSSRPRDTDTSSRALPEMGLQTSSFRSRSGDSRRPDRNDSSDRNRRRRR